MNPAGPILLVEPYLGGSHRAWIDGLVAHVDVPFAVVGHPARWWTWRMRGSAVTLAEQCRALDVAPAAVVVSDMTDLAAFRTFARDTIGDAPVALYFHESQLTYPTSPQMRSDASYAFTNWTSALAADVVWFNSHHHRDVFFGELPGLLRRFPDYTHAHLIDEVRERSSVLEVGVDLGWVGDRPARDGPIRLLWNHRWDHDKDPVAFFDAVDVVAGEGHQFELVVCGPTFRQRSDEFEAAADRHRDRLVHMGHASRPAYERLLLGSDVVVSTARQEFFGISVVEAAAAGCLPLVPDRLAYPEVIPAAYHHACLYPDGTLVDRLRWAVTHPDEVRGLGAGLAPHMARWGWAEMAPRYREAMVGLVSGRWPSRTRR